MNQTLLTTAIVSALATPLTAQAIKYKLSGQVNRAIVFMDDGAQSDVRNVDSETSGTRFRLRGSEDLGNGMMVGFHWELQTSSAASTAQTPDQDGDGTNGTTSGAAVRYANVWFSSSWGRLTIGQGDGAGNGATEKDLSGTGHVLYHGRTSHTGGIRWRTSAGGTIACGGAAVCTQGNTFNKFDAFSRYDAIRYDSPALGPVTLAASVGNDALWEVAARLSTAIGGGELGAALFYGEDSGPGNVDSRWGGSASYLFAQGTNVTFAYATNDPDGTGTDSDVWTVKLGHKWGRHAVAALYGESEDATPMFEDQAWGIAYNHALSKVSTELYAAFLHTELDTPASTAAVEDHDVFLVGARVRFD